ncbi:hypothetical protein [Burkholderia pseudomallei]|uniref:hypothetical protein n=1 Tax=Burkholderia pseudomallei TaxID=28450 RepID=UPI000538354A|nr:hypothetical protein [Burkholderia pseudomallei]KAA8769434.1 hypothetical protein F5D26_07795 [Burkholderia pseudomallei]KGW56730.1 hypothetical protein Y042_1709 [Burkholderia pseudomallei MSHR1357]KKC13598.1 hypothetical protein BBL_4732 [Burkholderia pseudomallei MSHR1328]
MSLTYQSHIVVEPSIGGVFGAAGVGVKLLQFSFNFALVPWQQGDPDIRIDSLSAKVSVVPRAGGIRYLGRGEFEMPQTFRRLPNGGRSSSLLRVDVTDSQLLALEDLRGSGGLEFEVQLTGRGHSPRETVPVEDRLRHTVNLSDWAQVLGQLGFADIFVLGVEMPVGPIPNELASAVKLLRDAQRLLVAGEYELVVASCRQALDSMQAVLERDTEIKSVRTERSMRPRDQSKLQRALAILDAVRHYTHLAHHVDGDGRAEWYSRKDATMVLTTSCALLTSATEWLWKQA